jgi:hypothetical protein
MTTWTSQTVTDQLTSMLAERRRQTRDRRSAYLALAHAIISDGPDEHIYLLEQQPTPLSDWRGHAA